MPTVSELTQRSVELRNSINESKKKMKELVAEYHVQAKSNKDARNEIQKINIEIRALKTQEKVRVQKERSEQKLAALQAAKDAASHLEPGILMRGRANSATEAAAIAAHRSVQEQLEGNLDEEVNVEEMRSALDIFH